MTFTFTLLLHSTAVARRGAQAVTAQPSHQERLSPEQPRDRRRPLRRLAVGAGRSAATCPSFAGKRDRRLRLRVPGVLRAHDPGEVAGAVLVDVALADDLKARRRAFSAIEGTLPEALAALPTASAWTSS